MAASSRHVRNQFQSETGLELVFIGFSASCETVPRPRLALVSDISWRLERRLRCESVLIWPIIQSKKVREVVFKQGYILLLPYIRCEFYAISNVWCSCRTQA